MINRLKKSLQPLNLFIEQQLMARYQQLESNEQRIVVFAAIALPLIIMIFAIMLPLQDKQQSLQQQLRHVQANASEARQLASYLNQHGKASESTQNTETLLTTVERLARQSKVRRFISRIKPQSSPTNTQQQLMLRLKHVPYTAALRFIHSLAEHRLGLKSMKLQRDKQAGMVNLYAIISAAT